MPACGLKRDEDDYASSTAAYAQGERRFAERWIALEFQRKARVWVDDRNSEAADAYGVTNIAAGFTQQGGRWRLQEYLRVDNLTRSSSPYRT